MAVRHISSNQTNQEVFLADDDTWIVDTGVTMSVTDDPAFFGAPAFTGNTIRVQGTIETLGAASYAILANGSHTKVVVSAGGNIDAVLSGIALKGNQSQVTNNGEIVAAALGIQIDGDKGLVQNDGTITLNDAGTGIRMGGTGGEIENTNTITANVAGSIGVDLNTGASDTASLFNGGSGTITGAEFSVVGGDGRDRVTNRGTLNGDVALSAGNDVFDTAGGAVNGGVFGGFGNDTYILGNTGIAVTEQSGAGRDKVTSSATYTLGNNLELLTLTGAAAIDGTGNASNNTLAGNNAANELDGAGGRDRLIGKGGADILTGGAAADTFVFANAMGKDVVTDFEATGTQHDRLDLRAVTAITNFNDLSTNHMDQVGADVVIRVNNQNTITLDNVDISDLNKADFLF